MSTTTDDLKTRHRAMWALGDYPAVATEVIAPLGDVLVDACGIGPGQRVVDIAAGSGNAAIPAARRGADVVATDLTPELLDIGRRAADAEGVSLALAGRRRRGHALRGRGAGRRDLVSSASCSPRTTRPPPTSWSASSARAAPSA